MIPSWLQIYLSEATAALLGPGDNLQADRAESDLDDPDLGADALVNDAAGGGGKADDGSGAGGSEGGGGVGAWPDDNEDDDEPRPARSSATTIAGPSSGPPAQAASANENRARPCSAALPRSPRIRPRRPGRERPRPRRPSTRGSQKCLSWCRHKHHLLAPCSSSICRQNTLTCLLISRPR